jgi:hypothetical protein
MSTAPRFKSDLRGRFGDYAVVPMPDAEGTHFLLSARPPDKYAISAAPIASSNLRRNSTSSVRHGISFPRRQHP